MAKPQLSLEARRVRMMIWTAPIMAGTAFVLYKRLVMEEPQRKLPPAEVSIRVPPAEQQSKPGH